MKNYTRVRDYTTGYRHPPCCSNCAADLPKADPQARFKSDISRVIGVYIVVFDLRAMVTEVFVDCMARSFIDEGPEKKNTAIPRRVLQSLRIVLQPTRSVQPKEHTTTLRRAHLRRAQQSLWGTQQSPGRAQQIRSSAWQTLGRELHPP